MSGEVGTLGGTTSDDRDRAARETQLHKDKGRSQKCSIRIGASQQKVARSKQAVPAMAEHQAKANCKKDKRRDDEIGHVFDSSIDGVFGLHQPDFQTQKAKLHEENHSAGNDYPQ